MFEGLKVYISSTSVDLAQYRAEVIAALRKSGFFPICMEDYVAQDKLPVDKCLGDVARCDLYVGIFAWRYGFTPPGYDKSITELEYRKALEKGIPTLLFLLDEKADWPSEYCDTRQDAARISALREEFQLGKTINWFPANPDKLASVVQAALTHAEREIHLASYAKLQAERYAEVSIASTPEQAASVQQAMALLQEAMKQQAAQASQTKRNPVPILLPKLKGVFVDREAERDTLYHSLMTDDKRLVVIVAPGGYGKTELTTKVLSEIAPSNNINRDDIQGILYLKCVRGDITLGHIFSEAGRIAGKRDEFRDVYASKELTLARKLEYFFSELSKAGNIWVVMDNFEDLLDPADDSIRDEEIREFLETSAGVEHTIRMIVTSRAVPSFKGSRKLEKIDLSKGLPEDQAIRYLREEGQEYGLDHEDEDVLRAFVRRVHCIPKALESVIGYLEEHYPAVTLRDIIAKEEFFVDFDRHDFENGLKKLIFEQIKIQAPDAQLLLSVLSIFSKPTPLAALRYLLPAIGPADFAALLTRLEKNRLLSQNNNYYDLHPLVRSFVYERIPETAPKGHYDGENPSVGLLVLSRSVLHSRAAEFFYELRKPKEEWKTIDDLEPQLQEILHLVRAGQYDTAARVLCIIDFNYLQLWGYPKLVIELREQLLGKLQDEDLKATNSGYLGNVYYDIGQVRKALAYYEEALEIDRAQKNKNGICAWLGELGNVWTYLGETKKAIEYYEQALTISREIGDKILEETHLGNLGNAYFYYGETKKAIEYHEQALTISREIGDKRGDGYNLGNLGSSWSVLGETRKAIEYYEQTIEIARETGDRRVEGTSLVNLGSEWFDLGETRKAIEYYEQALMISLETAGRRVEGACLGNLGNAWSKLGETKKAIKFYEKALTIGQEIEDIEGERSWLVGLGNAWSDLGETRKAIEYYEQALTISRETGDRSGEGKRLVNLGIAWSDLGETRKAIECYEQALTISRETGDRSGEGADLGNLSNAWSALGETRKAIEFHEQALAIAREIGDRRGEGFCLSSMGGEYLNLNKSNEAKVLFEEAINIGQETGYHYGEGARLAGLGLSHFMSGDAGKAIECYEQALTIAQDIESPDLVSHILSESGCAHHHLGQIQEAEENYKESLAFNMHSNNYRSAAFLGILWIGKGSDSESKACLNQSVALCREALAKTPGLYEQTYTLALVMLAQGTSEEALQTCRKALEICSAKGVVKRALMDLELLERAAPSTPGLSQVKQLLNDAMAKDDG